MKKFGFKKMLSAVMAASIVTGSVSAINALAASPRIYVDIVYEDANTPRADIYFENVPEICVVGFHVKIGSGWDTAIDRFGDVNISRTGTTSDIGGQFTYRKSDTDEGVLFITLTTPNGFNYDFNGKFLSIYLEKTDQYTPENANINTYFIDGDHLSHNNYDGTYVNHLNVMETNPIMLRADEYIIGDANGDHRVDARDCSEILSGIDGNGILSVYEIRNSYKDIFTKAEAPAAPDADQNGYINKKDSDDVLHYYASHQAGSTYEGSIGSIDVYETFSD